MFIYVHRNLTTFINTLFMFQKHDLVFTFQGPIESIQFCRSFLIDFFKKNKV